MGILLNGNKPSKIIYNGAEPSLYYNGSKIWPEGDQLTQWKCRVEGSKITCKYLKFDNVYPLEPYTFADPYWWDDNHPEYAYYMIQGRNDGWWANGGDGNYFESTFYLKNKPSTFTYMPRSIAPTGEYGFNAMSETTLRLYKYENGGWSNEFSSVLTPAWGFTYNYNLT